MRYSQTDFKNHLISIHLMYCQITTTTNRMRIRIGRNTILGSNPEVHIFIYLVRALFFFPVGEIFSKTPGTFVGVIRVVSDFYRLKPSRQSSSSRL